MNISAFDEDGQTCVECVLLNNYFISSLSHYLNLSVTFKRWWVLCRLTTYKKRYKWAVATAFDGLTDISAIAMTKWFLNHLVRISLNKKTRKQSDSMMVSQGEFHSLHSTTRKERAFLKIRLTVLTECTLRERPCPHERFIWVLLLYHYTLLCLSYSCLFVPYTIHFLLQ